MRPSPQPLSPFFRQYQQELDAWMREQGTLRRNARLRMGIICLGAVAYALLTHWCHTAVRSTFCAQSTITCAEFNNPRNHWHWSYWGVAAMLALAIIGAGALASMTAIWFSSLSRRLHIRGPATKTENRLTFIRWYCVITTVTLGYGLFWYMIVHLGR
ncbi:MAG TPA: hypothetical protein VJ843_03500 [Candidatus Saccharimonadales bacterium]|nr:hypothetical protein [Candidatus Saccharimonadales bacterium]